MYPNGAQEILSGCNCGARLFFYIKKKHLTEGKEFIAKLTDQDKVQMERDIASLSTIKVEENKPVVLDFESIQMLKPGQYEIDLIHLMKRDPLVFKLGEGKYMIDIPKLFKN